jgi:hypothetical protein
MLHHAQCELVDKDNSFERYRNEAQLLGMSESHRSATTVKPIRAAASIMVGVMAASDAWPQKLARWRRLTPLATWVTIELAELSHAGIFYGVAAALDRFAMVPRHLILLGEGPVVRSALELVLRGALPCGGIVAIDVFCGALPFRIVPTAAAIRLVVHQNGSQRSPDSLTGALRAADLDARIINLNTAGDCAAGAAASAAETFVLELVATIGRQARDGAGNR